MSRLKTSAQSDANADSKRPSPGNWTLGSSLFRHAAKSARLGLRFCDLLVLCIAVLSFSPRDFFAELRGEFSLFQGEFITFVNLVSVCSLRFCSRCFFAPPTRLNLIKFSMSAGTKRT